jgi:hydroxypyruvate isomerase
MIEFAPNLYHQFLEVPVRERLAAAAEAGFRAVEWHFPYELSKQELARQCAEHGLRFTYAVVPVDWRRDKGLAALPGREADFRAAAEKGLDYASHVGFTALQVGAGQVPPGVDRQACLDVFAKNLDWICGQAAGLPLTLCIEGVCNARFPGFAITTIADAAAMLRRVDRPNLKLVFDTYHLRMEETGPLLPLLERHWADIGHVQIGNAPGRHEPGEGEIDLHFLLDRLEERGWKAPIGLEYDPAHDTWTSLRWMQRYGYEAPRRPARYTGALRAAVAV